jgi:hypothetical protein
VCGFSDGAVRDRKGSELVRVNNADNVSLRYGLGLKPLVAAAAELFTLVSGSASDDLDRAINTTKNL